MSDYLDLDAEVADASIETDERNYDAATAEHGWFYYCEPCKSFIRTDGIIPGTSEELAVELQEHLAEMHD